jgi:hypothetical protein
MQQSDIGAIADSVRTPARDEVQAGVPRAARQLALQRATRFLATSLLVEAFLC